MIGRSIVQLGLECVDLLFGSHLGVELGNSLEGVVSLQGRFHQAKLILGKFIFPGLGIVRVVCISWIDHRHRYGFIANLTVSCWGGILCFFQTENIELAILNALEFGVQSCSLDSIAQLSQRLRLIQICQR